jgi:hypothetical protein
MKTAPTRIESIRAVLAVTVTAATLLAPTACQSGRGGNTAAPGQDDKRAHSPGASAPASAAPTSPAPGQHDKRALQMLNQIIQGEFAAVRTDFDNEMQERLSCEKLSSAWAAYQQTLGSYQSHEDPQDVSRGDLTVVNVPLNMALTSGQLRVTFHSDGTIAGLYFLRAGIPVP